MYELVGMNFWLKKLYKVYVTSLEERPFEMF